jgi:hypothetical protein
LIDSVFWSNALISQLLQKQLLNQGMVDFSLGSNGKEVLLHALASA